MPYQADHVADSNGVELFRLAKVYEFPDFVKLADQEKNFSPRSPIGTTFADPVRKQYPCDTKASTWLSALYYQEKKAEFHPKDQAKIEERLNKSAQYWAIQNEVDKLREVWAQQHKTAESQLPDHMYAIVEVSENGVKERHYPLTNAMEVKVAAEYLEKYRDRFPFKFRHTMANKILEKAAKYGAGIGAQRETLEKQAGYGVCDPQEVISLIKSRAALSNHPDVKGQYLKMAQAVKDAPRMALLPENLIKLAETLDTLDRISGFNQRYAELQRPEDVLFKVTFSKAADDLQKTVATTSGKVYEKSAFAKLALADVRSLFGDEFSDLVRTPLGEVDIEKFSAEIGALPRPDAALLEALLSDSGISPLMSKAASARQGLSNEEIQAWAQAYETAQ